MIPPLKMLRGEKLLDFVRDLLHDRGQAAGWIDRSRQELPFEALVTAFESNESPSVARLHAALGTLLKESARVEWEMDAFKMLMMAIEGGRVMVAVGSLARHVSARSWAEQEAGRLRHAFGLRTLVGLGWRGGSRGFWLREHDRASRKYPALIFRALANHGLDAALAELPRLIDTPGDVSKILRLFPRLQDQHIDFEDRALRASENLAWDLARRIEQWFEGRSGLSRVARTAKRVLPTGLSLVEERSLKHALLAEVGLTG